MRIKKFQLVPRGGLDILFCLSIVLLLIQVNNAFKNRVGLEYLEETGDGNVFRQLVYIFILGICIVKFRANKENGSIFRIFPISLLVLFAWSLVTLMWSGVPEIGLRRLGLTLLVSIIVFKLVDAANPEFVLMRFRQIIFALCLLSFLVVIALPHIGIHQSGDQEVATIGGWRGIFYHKNIFGAVIAPGTILTLHYMLVANKSGKVVLLGQFFFLYSLLWMTGSKTSFATAVLCCACYFFLTKYSRSDSYFKAFVKIVCFLVVFVGVAAALLFALDSVSLILSEDSFTGRGLIWMSLLEVAREQFWIGLGFQSVFQVGLDSPLAILIGRSIFLGTLPHAHNAYIEMLISIGFIGFIIFLYAVVVSPANLVLSVNGRSKNVRALLFSLFLFLWLHGLLESGLFDRDRADWIVFLITLSVAIKVNGLQKI